MRIKNKAELARLLRRTSSPPRENGREKTPVRLLGIDTALRTTGFAVVDASGSAMSAVDCGVIKNSARAPLSQCLKALSEGMTDLVENYGPDMAVIEGAFYCRNVRTAMILGAARGAVISTLAQRNIPIYEYAPRRVKQSVCGFGNASKQQVAILVAQFLQIDVSALSPDATDALALAICHAQTRAVAQGLSVPPTL